MRKIKTASGLEISFSHAGAESEALTTVNINIPIDGNKYIQGLNIIDCIKELILPNLNVGAITQVLTPEQLDLLGGLVTSGTISIPVSNPTYDLIIGAYSLSHLLIKDDAALGIVDYELGKTKPTYTP